MLVDENIAGSGEGVQPSERGDSWEGREGPTGSLGVTQPMPEAGRCIAILFENLSFRPGGMLSYCLLALGY